MANNTADRESAVAYAICELSDDLMNLEFVTTLAGESAMIQQRLVLGEYVNIDGPHSEDEAAKIFWAALRAAVWRINMGEV